MVPGAEAKGLVAPRRTASAISYLWRWLLMRVISLPRPVLTTSLPSQTMAQIGPESMYWIKPLKKGLPARSASAQVRWHSTYKSGLEVRTVFLEVLLAWGDELDGSKLVSAQQKSVRASRAIDKTRLELTYPRCSKREMMGPTNPRYIMVNLNSIWQLTGEHTWTPSGWVWYIISTHLSYLEELKLGTHLDSNEGLFGSHFR